MSKYVLVDDNGVEYPTDSAVYRTRLVALGYKVKEDTHEVEVHDPEKAADVPATAVGSSAEQVEVTEEKPKPRPRRRTAATKKEDAAEVVPDSN